MQRFEPATWLRDRHLQTVFGPLFRRAPRLGITRERWELSDGDFLDVDRLPGPDAAPLLVVLHGLEGSSSAHYVLGLLAQARLRGWRALGMNFRSCSGEPNRLLRSYHSGETGDLDEAVRRASQGGAPLLAAGCSLGGNVLVKWLGEQGRKAPVRAAAALSVPFDLKACARALDAPDPMSFVYRTRFLRSLKRKAVEKARRFPEQIDVARVRAARTLFEFDEALTAPVHGFAGAEDYWTQSSSGPYLERVRVPLLLVSAEDDPFIPAESLPRAAAAANPSVMLETFPAAATSVSWPGRFARGSGRNGARPSSWRRTCRSRLRAVRWEEGGTSAARKGFPMSRTAILFAVVLASAAAAAVAAIRLQRKPVASATVPPQPVPPPQDGSSPLTITTRLDRRWLDSRGGESYLEIGVAAAGVPERGPRTAVNAVLIIDRSGSMSGAKIDRARDAARALVAQLDAEDRLAIVDFASDARVLVPSAPATAGFKERASALIGRLQATTGTNLSAALNLAAPQLEQGKGTGRLDKVLLASDGLANEGVVDRTALLAVARRDFGEATVSTFGIGEDYDEDLMTALAAQAGGRTRFIRSADELPPAVRAELTRASRAVAREVRLDVRAAGGARIVRVLGYPSEGGWIRLPDFAAGEERRVLVKLALPAAPAGAVEVARVALSFADAQGTAHRAEASAEAAFTADRSLLGLPPTDALAHGVRAELADLAQSAAELKGAGRADEAHDKVARMRQVVRSAAQFAAASVAIELQDEESAYATGVSGISGANDAPSKAVKQKAFDAVRAPVAGW